MTTQQFTIAEVNQHNKANDIWIILHDKVYNVTKFLNEHPGGEEVLLEVAGKEASKEFDDVGHSTSAMELLENYFIGDIVESERRSANSNNEASNKRLITAGISALIAGLGAVILFKGFRMHQSN